MSADKKVVIIGAGPTGLGAAVRLMELKHANFHLYDGGAVPGGLSRSVLDEKGFLWDMGGHVIFSHYAYFDDVMNLAISDWNTLQRESWVRCSGAWVPYPFQSNIHRLPPEVRDTCLKGIEEAEAARAVAAQEKPQNFAEYVSRHFGEGIAEVFMRPYNFKVWAVPLHVMSTEWVGERVAAVNVERIRENIQLKRDDIGWGPNATFRFPKSGGTGAIYKAVWKMIPEAHKTLGPQCRVTKVNPITKTLTMASGEAVSYDALVSTMPLDDLLLAVAAGVEEDAETASASALKSPRLREIAEKMVYSSTHIIGIGVKGCPPPEMRTACWLYFPDDGIPFYRATIFSRYADTNAPEGHWSILLEVSQNVQYKPVNVDTVVEDCIAGLRTATLLRPEDEIVSRWHHIEKKGYPIPFVGRNELLEEVQPVLRDKYQIYSRGRFGAWRYEVANQDHSLMQGVEAVGHIFHGTDEDTVHKPEKVNTQRGEMRCTLSSTAS
ncbi:UDP-galactopyranose mutase [Leishmania donovani]|uniref:UDP-galactopyranose_mutase n=3 Tax=Leishmania donovani species complex TaxID=38574 RepID=A0A6L0XEJ3_LEIIN|nr:UDP-galactopyranose mutase [Leishmania infantum JPCM5]XP_003860034.1 UDP-galactopyranose mutase [Leishmania donovani]CAC9479665.1 UDP-galactopyranose_mutase [Leishmania infantum]AYU77946.1 UDP-galactopyranose mutase [Leishmania donovani]TPP53307.1 NAD(P)-binding Rossmann-like domain family protein [Leishmania donovani]TPP55322.1 NAD(P)-binding Rossmann-like domain family protein [Leishmania donovani]CAJ1987963.1 UDP-galactopyranose mutase [Leishmania donovani]|eukprot:XP_001464837.1 UDP-galactopyranose mutase [Leishmania infantum JPCM5]